MSIHTDTLIVGAGSAGLFCALGSTAHGSVILAETGPDPGSVPPRWALYDYALPAEHYHRYADLDSGQTMPQGRGLGGGSTVNSAAALRGQPWCYDSWGVEGWGWDDLLPAFRAIESDQQFGERDYHGDDGLIPITRLEPGPLDDAVLTWCDAAGHPRVADHNAPGALGHGMWTTNRQDGGRWGTYAGVVPSARRAGVDIRTDTTVTKLIFDGARCVGAELAGPSGVELVQAGRVILCAGAYGSPSLLIRSGIGPEHVLSDLDIAPVSVLPGVGANVGDHPWCLLDVDVVDPALIEARPVSGALLRYELPSPLADHVEAEIFAWQAKPYDLSAPSTRVSFTAALMAPRSRGSFTLTPAGPRLRMGLLSEDSDAEHMADIVERTAKMVQDLAGQGVVRVPTEPWWHAEDLVAACRRQVGTYNHHAGTCRLGPADAENTVVNEQLGVLGVSNLAIADSSVIPTVPRANTNLLCMSIGYRAADLVAKI